MPILTPEQIEILKMIDAPTLCNAIEKFDVRHHTEGYMGMDIKCLMPELGVMVGYAVTALVDSTSHVRTKQRDVLASLWEAVNDAPKPSVVVFQDIGSNISHSAHCGDMMATTAQRLGAVGLVSHGGVRDIAGVRKLGFHYFAPGLVPSHGNPCIVEVNVAVTVSGVFIKPGDLVHGDENGVVVIPLEIAAKVADAAEQVRVEEQGYIDYVTGPNFTIQGLRRRITGQGFE